MINFFSRSLSLRLLAIFLLFAALFAYGSMLAVRGVYKADDLRELISGHLSLHVNYVRNDIGDPPDIDRARAITQSVPVDIRIHGPDLDWASDPNFPPITALSFGESRFFGDEPEAWLNQLEDVEFAELKNHRFLRLLQGDYSIIVSTTKISDNTRAPPLLPIIIGMGLTLVLLTYLAVRWLFLPIREVRAGAARIGRGDFDHRIERVRHDELGELANDVNKVAADVQGMLDAKRQLLLGISHELRTPLSRLKLSLEFLDKGDDRKALSVEIDEMEKIIVTLVEAERLNDRHVTLHRSAVDPNKLVQDLLDNYFSRDKSRIRVVTNCPDAIVFVDEPRITLLLKNLLSNALRYSTDQYQSVELRIAVTHEELEFAVSDHGPGFPATQIEHIGEPFWRGDPSRTRGTGGSGLGLYLSKLVAEAHGGGLALDQSYREGARFVAAISLRPAS